MRAPEPPANEPERLAALARYHILDTLPELQYDEIVELAAYICGTPIALISFVDDHRQWFKASVGVEARETPRDVSFCGHVVAQGSTMIVEDAKQDERFFDNPYVVGEPHVNFYAGAPLATDEGYTLGSLCVIDRQPRQLGVEQREALEALARVVVRLLESQLHEAELREARRAAEAANQAKSEFLAKMSHELRTPLNSVIGFTNLLRRNDKGKLDAKELMYLDKISRNGLHLLSLIDDLLDLSKIEAGHAQLELAQLHGFELGVASVVGEGATFYLRLDPAAPIPNHRKPVHSTVTSRT